MSKWNKTFINKKDNVLVKDAMSKFVFMNSNGKYLRALLIALGYFIATKKDDNSYLPLAAAYETFQTSILIHDDVIDNAELRRGKKTIHKKYEEKFHKYDLKDNKFDERKKNTSTSIGICAGDIGFFIANNIIVESYMNNPNLPRVLKYYNDIVINTGKGELIDVVLPFNEQYYSKNKCLEKDIMEIYDLKTSWYTIVGPCSLGMILGGNSNRVVESMVKTLSPLGTAFQIKDDILGIYGSIKNIGKSNTSDISEFKQTLLYSYVVNNTEYKEELRKYYGKEELTDKDLLKVREIFDKSGAREYAIKKMDELFKQSKSLVLKNRNIPY
jgi:geranylgeranyl diphosphate synthase type I